MSRSSTKLFSGVTWSAGTPATSSTISPRPARISGSVMAMCLCSPSLLVIRPRRRPGAMARLGYRDHLSRVADACAEPEQQDGRARADLAPFDHLGQGQRDRRRRGVARGHDVVGDKRLRGSDLPRDGFDDPEVRLVRDEGGQFRRIDPRALAGQLRDRVQRGGRPPEHGLALLDDKRVTVLDGDFVRHPAVTTPHNRTYAWTLVRIRDRADHRGAGPVSEDDGG